MSRDISTARTWLMAAASRASDGDHLSTAESAAVSALVGIGYALLSIQQTIELQGDSRK